MKIYAINSTTFGEKQRLAQKTILVGMSAVAGSEFVKGLSKPNKDIEKDNFIRSNDDGGNPCDLICDPLYGVEPSEREQTPCEACDEDCK